MQLRPYQQAAIDSVYDHLRTRSDNPCVVIPTAGGKTPVMASICKDAVQQWDGRVLILAHVKELLEQTADKLQAVCPELDFGINSASLKRRDTRHSVIVAGIQSVYRRACELDAFDLVLVDECFVAGTLIKTPSGDIPIEQVQPGMFVCHARGVDRVVATSARAASELVTLEYSDGSTITCTPNHPIFTESGWAKAGSLELGSLAIGVEGMRMLWKSISALDETTGRRQSQSSEGEALDEPAILLDLLLEDPQQLHAIVGGSQEGKQNNESPGALAHQTRRQRANYRATTSAVESLGTRLDWRDRRSSAGSSAKGFAYEPKNRCSESATENRDRTRWNQSPLSEAQTARLSEDNIPGAKRLVGISHHKSAGGRVVFNLHVAGHPSYFANGTLVHNCHLIPLEGDGMYRQFLSEAQVINPQLRVIGFTATPFRLKHGSICSSDGFLNHICYEVGVRELIRDGYLCPLITKAGRTKADTSQLHVRGGEFVADEVESLMNDSHLVESACSEIVALTVDRNACLIFASGIQHARNIVEILATEYGLECGFVCGETPIKERDSILDRFRRGGLKYLCNVNVLTTGFDAPHIDCVALLRPTMSPGLYYQMVGRGFRLHPSKSDCLILDFGGNVLRHGPVDQLKVKPQTGSTGVAPAKECPQCQAVVSTGFANCPQCGFAFPPPERQKHDASASDEGILTGQATSTQYEVQDVHYHVHVKRGAAEGSPRTMRVDYQVGWNQFKSEWICLEHTGYAYEKALAWWKQRSPDPLPDSIERAVEIAHNGGLTQTISITVRKVAGESFERIIDYQLGSKPESIPVDVLSAYDSDDVPF